VLVENINRVKRHTKANPQATSRRDHREGNAAAPGESALWNPAAKKGDRVGIKTLTTARRCAFFKSNGEVIDA